MAVNLVTGSAGTPHITGSDVGHLLAGVVGPDYYVLKTKDWLHATMSSANSLSVGAGDAVMHGRHVRLDSAETVTIESGSQGQRRNDLVCLHYYRTTEGDKTVERANVAVLKGTPTTGTPADPTVPSGNVLQGASEDWFPLWRVSLDGLTVGTPVQLYEVLTPLDGLRDELSKPSAVEEALKAKPVNALQSQAIDDINVYAHWRLGTLTVHVDRDSQGADKEMRVPKSGEWLLIGQLKDGYQPSVNARTLLGVQNGVWLHLMVTVAGAIYLYTMYATDQTWWSDVHGTVSAVTQSAGALDMRAQSVLESQAIDDINVYAHWLLGTLTVHVDRDSQGADKEMRVPKSGEWLLIGQVKAGYYPTVNERTLLGVQNGVWLHLMVTVSGAIYLYTMYATDQTWWSDVHGTVSSVTQVS